MIKQKLEKELLEQQIAPEKVYEITDHLFAAIKSDEQIELIFLNKIQKALTKLLKSI